MAAVACRLAALILGLRGLTYLLMFIPFFFYLESSQEMSYQYLFTMVVPFALFLILAIFLWSCAGRLGRAVVPADAASSTLSGISVQGMTAAAVCATGLILGATSIPRIIEKGYNLIFMNDYLYGIDPYATGELAGALAGLTLGLALFFGGGWLSRYLEEKRNTTGIER